MSQPRSGEPGAIRGVPTLPQGLQAALAAALQRSRRVSLQPVANDTVCRGNAFNTLLSAVRSFTPRRIATDTNSQS